MIVIYILSITPRIVITANASATMSELSCLHINYFWMEKGEKEHDLTRGDDEQVKMWDSHVRTVKAFALQFMKQRGFRRIQQNPEVCSFSEHLIQ